MDGRTGAGDYVGTSCERVPAGGRPMVDNKIGAVLTDVGLSRSELARNANIPYATLRRVINGGGDLPLAYALSVARVLQMRIEELFRLPANDRANAPTQARAGQVRDVS